MAEPFDSNDPGDETRRYGDYIDVPAAEELYGGEAVTLDGNGEATRVGADAGDTVVGYVYGHAASGEDVTIKVGGIGIAAVSPDAAEGGTVGTTDGSTATNMAAGELSEEGNEYVVRQLGTKTDPRTGESDNYAEVFRR